MTSEELIEDNRNKLNVRCRYCNSFILRKQEGDYEVLPFDLPLMHQKNNEPEVISSELLNEFWVIDDMFKFENIGLSNTVDWIKYLICADCEMGPVGYHDLHSKKCYVSLSRVHHGDEPYVFTEDKVLDVDKTVIFKEEAQIEENRPKVKRHFKKK